VQTLSVVIVHYRTPEALRVCLNSLEEADEIIVIDNSASKFDISQLNLDFPNVIWKLMERNIGFGAACNVGLKSATKDLVLFLNPDAAAKPGALSSLITVFSDQTVVACGGKLEFPNGSLQESACGRLTLGAVFREQTLLEKFFIKLGKGPLYWQSGVLLKQGAGPFEVSQVMGACLMVRRDLALKTLFDEDFFLYCEDTDFCKRLTKLGKILYVPEAQFSHELGLSTSENRWWSVAMYNRGKELYFLKHHGKLAWLICVLIDRAGAKFRITGGLLTLRMPYSKLFWRVLWAPIQGPKLPEDSL